MLNSANYLKQSTAVTLKLGPFLDETDFITPLTALTISQADVRLSKNGAAFAQKNDANAAVHDEAGWYGVELNTTDTNTLGRLQVAIHEGGALSIAAEFMVVTANVWDSLFASDFLQVDVEQVNGDSDSATRLGLAAFQALPGTVEDSAFSPTTSEFEAADIVEATSSHFVGRHVIFTSGALLYEARIITAYSLSAGKGHFTVETMTDAPADTDTFIIV